MKITDSKHRLEELMEAYDLRPIDIVTKTGISKACMSRYITGERIPKQDKVSIISEAFHVDPAWLMGYDVPMEMTYNKSKAIIDAQITSLPEFDTLAEGYLNAPDSVKEAILTLLKPYVK